MSYEFVATTVSIDDDGEVVVIGISNDETAPTKYLMFQWENENVRSGDEEVPRQIYIEFNDQIQSVYGGLGEIIYKNDIVTFHFDDYASSKLRIDGAIEVKIVKQATEFSHVISMFENIAAQYGVTIIQDW